LDVVSGCLLPTKGTKRHENLTADSRAFTRIGCGDFVDGLEAVRSRRCGLAEVDVYVVDFALPEGVCGDADFLVGGEFRVVLHEGGQCLGFVGDFAAVAVVAFAGIFHGFQDGTLGAVVGAHAGADESCYGEGVFFGFADCFDDFHLVLVWFWFAHERHEKARNMGLSFDRINRIDRMGDGQAVQVNHFDDSSIEFDPDHDPVAIEYHGRALGPRWNDCAVVGPVEYSSADAVFVVPLKLSGLCDYFRGCLRGYLVKGWFFAHDFGFGFCPLITRMNANGIRYRSWGWGRFRVGFRVGGRGRL
jgi:hypothetical protein